MSLTAGLVDPAAGATSTSGQASAAYTVRPGDTLYGIARRFGVPLDALAAANRRPVQGLLLAGQVLTIPGPATLHTTTGTTYTVRRGDTLYGIARRHGTALDALLAANGLTAGSLILPGRVLVLPGTAGPALPAGLPAGLPADLLRRPDALALVPAFRSAAAEFGIPADLLMSLAYRESGWHPEVRSPSGAIGIGQLLPGTATWVATTLLQDPGLDPTVATHNIRMTARLMRWMLDRFGGDVRLALAAYAVGAGAVSRTGVSPEVDRSLQLVLSRRSWFV